MQPKGKSSLALWGEAPIDPQLHRGLPQSVATPLKRILGNRLAKGDRKTSNSRESNGHASRQVQLDMPHARQLLTEVSRAAVGEGKYIVPSKYGQHHRNKMEELQGRIFKTHHLSSLGNRDDHGLQNQSLLFNSTMPQKRLPFGYYLPATMKNRSSGLRTHNSQTNHDSLDLDTYLMRINRSRNPGNQTATYAYLDRTRKGIAGLLHKKKSSDKSPVSQLNKTYDFADKLKPKSKHSRSSKKSRPGSLGAVDETELDTGKSVSWRHGRRASEQVPTGLIAGKSAYKSELKPTSAKRRKKSQSKGKYASTDNAEKTSIRTTGMSLDLFEKLQKVYAGLKDILDGSNPHSDAAVTEVSELFGQFVKIQNKLTRSQLEKAKPGVPDDTDSATATLCSKLIKYFSHYNKKYVKSYVYTRNLALKSLKVLEEFIGQHKVAISRYVPSFFTAREQVTLVDAVKMMKDLTVALLHENKQLTSFIREQPRHQSKGPNASKREFDEKLFGQELEELRHRLNQNPGSSATEKQNHIGLLNKKKVSSIEETATSHMTKTKSSGEQYLRKNGGRGSQSSESKQEKKSRSKKTKQPAKASESNDAPEGVGKRPGKISTSPQNEGSPKREHEFGSAEGMALEADIEGGDYVKGRELVREMEDSAIMKFQSEEDYQRELGPSNLERLSMGGRNYPDHDMLSGEANNHFSGEPNPQDNSSFERAESSDDFVPVEALNNPELAKLLQQRMGSAGAPLGPDPIYSRGRIAPTVVVENEALKQKLKLNLPKVKATDGYHEEFMKHFEEFSPSWRDSLMKEKNSKYY